MHGRAHFLIGASLGVALAGGISIEQLLPAVAVTATSALLPDLDTPHSDASKLLQFASAMCALAVGGFVAIHVSLGPVLSTALGRAAFELIEQWLPGTAPMLVVLLLACAVGIATFLLAALAFSFARPSRYLEHRGPLHWPLLGLALTLGAVVLSELTLGRHDLAVAFGVGWFSHLVADLPTRGGMPVLMPLRRASHSHWREVEQGWQRPINARGLWCPVCRRVDCMRHEPYTCSMFHLTPPWLRWRSGNRKVELPLGVGALCLSILAATASSWLPVVAQLAGRA